MNMANMKNINSIQDVFPINLRDSLFNFVNNSNWKYGWRSNTSMGYAHWHYDYANVIMKNGIDISNQLPAVISESWQHLRSNYFSDSTLTHCYVNGHTFGTEGYPHIDSYRPDDKTVIVYINKTWRRDWGGETIIYDGNNILHAELPKGNKLLIFPGNLFHKASSVSRICPELRITLMFKFAPVNIDLIRDKLQIFLTQSAASWRKARSPMATANWNMVARLLHYSLSTYDLLKAAGQSNAVCCAGGVQSIFEPNHTPLYSEHFNVIAPEVGEEATYLVQLLNKTNRPGTLELALATPTTEITLNDNSKITIDKKTLNSLCAIECATLLSQLSLSKYENLQKYWNSIGGEINV